MILSKVPSKVPPKVPYKHRKFFFDAVGKARLIENTAKMTLARYANAIPHYLSYETEESNIIKYFRKYDIPGISLFVYLRISAGSFVPLSKLVHSAGSMGYRDPIE